MSIHLLDAHSMGYRLVSSAALVRTQAEQQYGLPRKCHDVKPSRAVSTSNRQQDLADKKGRTIGRRRNIPNINPNRCIDRNMSRFPRINDPGRDHRRLSKGIKGWVLDAYRFRLAW